MVFPVHLQRSAVVANVDCPDRGQFIGSRTLKQVALQWIWLFQETLIGEALRRVESVSPNLFSRIASARLAIDFRNLLAHDYSAVDDDVVFGVACSDLLSLKRDLESLLLVDQSPTASQETPPADPAAATHPAPVDANAAGRNRL